MAAMDSDSLLLPLIGAGILSVLSRVAATRVSTGGGPGKGTLLSGALACAWPGSLLALPLPRRIHRHRLIWPQAVGPVHNHFRAGLNSAVQNRRLPFSQRDLDRLHFRCRLAA